MQQPQEHYVIEIKKFDKVIENLITQVENNDSSQETKREGLMKLWVFHLVFDFFNVCSALQVFDEIA